MSECGETGEASSITSTRVAGPSRWSAIESSARRKIPLSRWKKGMMTYAIMKQSAIEDSRAREAARSGRAWRGCPASVESNFLDPEHVGAPRVSCHCLAPDRQALLSPPAPPAVKPRAGDASDRSRQEHFERERAVDAQQRCEQPHSFEISELTRVAADGDAERRFVAVEQAQQLVEVFAAPRDFTIERWEL